MREEGGARNKALGAIDTPLTILTNTTIRIRVQLHLTRTMSVIESYDNLLTQHAWNIAHSHTHGGAWCIGF